MILLEHVREGVAAGEGDVHLEPVGEDGDAPPEYEGEAAEAADAHEELVEVVHGEEDDRYVQQPRRRADAVGHVEEQIEH
eukprot:scaffold253_cov63-Phaeocystis_antarctica.AAC.1